MSEAIPSAQKILVEVSLKYGLPISEIIGRSRTRTVVKARTEVIERMRSERDMSYSEIAKEVQRDWSTVRDSLKKSEREKQSPG